MALATLGLEEQGGFLAVLTASADGLGRRFTSFGKAARLRTERPNLPCGARHETRSARLRTAQRPGGDFPTPLAQPAQRQWGNPASARPTRVRGRAPVRDRSDVAKRYFGAHACVVLNGYDHKGLRCVIGMESLPLPESVERSRAPSRTQWQRCHLSFRRRLLLVVAPSDGNIYGKLYLPRLCRA